MRVRPGARVAADPTPLVLGVVADVYRQYGHAPLLIVYELTSWQFDASAIPVNVALEIAQDIRFGLGFVSAGSPGDFHVRHDLQGKKHHIVINGGSHETQE